MTIWGGQLAVVGMEGAGAERGDLLSPLPLGTPSSSHLGLQQGGGSGTAHTCHIHVRKWELPY